MIYIVNSLFSIIQSDLFQLHVLGKDIPRPFKKKDFMT